MTDFYELGGNSLNAIRILSVIEKELNIKLYVKDILSNPIICDLSKLIENNIGKENSLYHMEIIEKRNCKEFPVTSQQLGVYLDSIKYPNSIIYNVPSILKLNKDIDIEKLKEAFNRLFQNQEILRSKYYEKENNGKIEVYGFIDDNCSLSFEEYTYDNIKSFIRPFDLSKSPLMRVGFIKDEVLLIDMHHIISDGSTMLIIQNELNNYYNNEKLNHKLEIQFSDYALYMKEKKNNEYYEKEIEFYKEMFSCEYELLNIPMKDRLMNNKDLEDRNIENNCVDCNKIIDKLTSTSINEYIKKHEISKAAFFISIYGYVLFKYTGQDIIYSSIINANKNNHYVENMIGMFVSTQPILLKYENENNSFLEIIKENMNNLMDIYNNQELSFAELLKLLKLKKVNNSFIYQPKVIFKNNIENSIFSYNDNIETFSLYENLNELIDNEISKFDITFNVIENEDNYLISVTYNSYLYESKIINEIVNSFIEVTKHISEFDNTINNIEYIPEIEKEKIINSFNNNVYEYDHNKFYHVEFSRIAKEKPNKCAVVCNNVEITFKQLDEMSNSLAHYLRKQNIGRNDIIPVISERSYFFIIAILAVMKSGAAYLPIDPEFPREQYKLETHNYENEKFEINNINESEDLCYLLYTSDDIFEDEIDNALAICKFTHDISIAEINYPLLRGSKIILSNDEEFNNPELLSNLITKYNVQYIFTVPSRMNSYMNVKWIILGGEKIDSNIVNKIQNNSNGKVLSVYGPTETRFSNIKIMEKIEEDDQSKITAGKPLCNFKMYILDKYLKPVPIGIKGEIYIAGVGVGKGYLNREELTKEKFIECPYYYVNGKPGIMYKTGDIGKWTEDGEIICLGRQDFQVKIRGQRIELGEIENCIKEIKGITNSVVIDKKNDNNDVYLIGYYISTIDINKLEIRNHLRNKLPVYMIPRFFKKLDKLPLTNNGKLDRRSLPELTTEDIVNEEYIAPESEVEKTICKIYSEIFNIEENLIGIMSNFYEIGGDSLNAIKIVSSIEKELKIKISIKEILSNPIICDLSKYIESITNDDNKTNNIDIIEKRNCKEFPVTSQQLGVYIDSIKSPELKEAFNKLFQNQEILRSKYYEKENNGKIEVYGFIDDNCSLSFEEYTYDNVKSFIRPFDLSKAPLMRVGFIKDEVLLIDLHHIIADGATMLIIQNELNNYYNDLEIQDLDIQFSDYAIDWNERKNNGSFEKQIEFYKEMFSCDYDLLNIPKKDTNINKLLENEKEKDKSMLVLRQNSIFINIYGYVLSKYSGQDIIYTSIMSANRNNRYVANMIGMLISTQPVLLKYENEESSFLETIKHNMNVLYDVYNNQDISFSELINSLKLKRINNSFIYQPYNRINNNNNNNNLINIFAENEFIEMNSIFKQKEDNNSKFDICLCVSENYDDYTITIEYNNELYDSHMISNILDSYFETLKYMNMFNNPVKEIEYIPHDTKEKIINGFNYDINNSDCNKLYHEEFCKMALQYPEKCAIVYNDIKISYKKLDELSNSLAHYLREHGITRNDIVPVICDRSYHYIISTLAISKAGGAFFPIDKKFPIDRIQTILSDVNPKIVILYDVHNTLKNKLNLDYNIYDIQNHDYNINQSPIKNINEPDDTCYVLSTSGTTGKPKATLVSHFNIYNYIRSFQGDNDQIHCIYNLFIKKNKVKNMLSIANFPFDLSHIEITFSLIHGLTIILVDDNLSEDISLFAEYIFKNDVDFITTTPTRFKLFMENDEI
ncbi:acetyl-CoA synthetase-like protein [Anaeromyces robustus]|uniref:Acetyl-CoA synthetase-like protein n=1 Tax=Anaeromyces robustus TaxID=1754192 RepID=A0A1Y1WNQ0_9FUNG|nr:acetyl-CoA synthetase-like protein [Anaeromyces robustus]|eukprot:ORX75177.1 acetyl-CoA synthetase-like protein [Anaeromyces robustus]